MKAWFYVPAGRGLMRFSFAFFCKRRRKQLGMTGPELAKAAGISKGLLSSIEHGADLQISTLNKLSKALRIYPTFGQRRRKH